MTAPSKRVRAEYSNNRSIECERPQTDCGNSRRGLTLNQVLVDWRATVNGTRTCSVDSCEKPQLAKGFCGAHWRRNHLYGDPLGTARPPRAKVCTAPDCTREDIQGQNYCRKHYHRVWRTGALDARVVRERRGTCTIPGCEKQDSGLLGLCGMHKSRLIRNGDPLIVKTPPGSPLEKNPRWVGDDASYTTLHQRVRKHKGKARHHLCVDCGEQAAHWSYNNSGHMERRAEDGRRYSLDLAQYEPRCVRCHSNFDANARLAEGRRRSDAKS